MPAPGPGYWLVTSGAIRHHALVTDWPSRVSGGVPSPEIVASWAQLGLLPTEKVPLWAAYWLVAGYDGEHLVHLAGLHGDDPHDVRDALPAALLDCGVAMPESDLAAATVVFTHLARMHVDGLAGPQWVGQKTEEVTPAGGGPTRNSPGSCAMHAGSNCATAPLRHSLTARRTGRAGHPAARGQAGATGRRPAWHTPQPNLTRTRLTASTHRVPPSSLLGCGWLGRRQPGAPVPIVIVP
jgi:hypothetical protein